MVRAFFLPFGPGNIGGGGAKREVHYNCTQLVYSKEHFANFG